MSQQYPSIMNFNYRYIKKASNNMDLDFPPKNENMLYAYEKMY